MINDVNLGGVFIPGLLVIALVTLISTLLVIPLFSCSKFYRHLPYRPLVDLSTFIVSFYLLLQVLTRQGFLS